MSRHRNRRRRRKEPAELLGVKTEPEALTITEQRPFPPELTERLLDEDPPTPRSGEYHSLDADIDVDGVTIDDSTAPDDVAGAAGLDVDAIVTAIVAAEPDGPTLEPDDDAPADIVATIDVNKFFEAAEDFATGLDRTLGDARAIGSDCVTLERLIALVIGEDVEHLQRLRKFQVFPDGEELKRGKLGQLELDDDAVLVVTLSLESGSIFLKVAARTLRALLRDLRPNDGLASLVSGLWNEQRAIEIGRQLADGDPGRE